MDLNTRSEQPLRVLPGTLDREGFVTRFGGVYEHSPWVAERAFDTGHAQACMTAAALSAVMADVLAVATHEEKRSLICAHPDLAGKLALAGELTAESTSEQAGAGLDQCTPSELEAFQRLNTAYKQTFAFPFIMAVKFSSRAEILAAFERRIDNTYETEFETALAEINKIALIRILDL